MAVAVALTACAPIQLPSPLPGPATLASPCVISDTTASTSDTIRVAGLAGYQPDRTATDCQGRPFHIDAAPVVVAIEPPSGSDMRDVLESRLTNVGVPQPDLLITRRPEVIDFARRSSAHIVDTLPWNTTYLLVTVGRYEALLPSADERDVLARDAVRAVARGAVEPFPWLTTVGCSTDSVIPLFSQPSAVIGYPTDDPIGRQLAERIVSLAGASTPPAWLPATLAGRRNLRVVPIAHDSLTIAPAINRATATVMPVSRDAIAQCGMTSNFTLPRGATPLIDVRDHVIIRRGSGAAILIDSRGALHFLKREQQ